MTFILIISISETKLRWYLYPTLPLLALLLAPCLLEVSNLLMRYLPTKRPLFTFTLIFIIPYLLCFTRIDHRNHKDLEKGSIAYGLFIDQHLHEIDSLYLPYLGYNPHTLFQIKRLEAKGKFATRIPISEIHSAQGKKILICEQHLLSTLAKQDSVIKQTDYCWLIEIK